MKNMTKKVLISFMVLASAIFSMNIGKVSAMGVSPQGYVQGLYFSRGIPNDGRVRDYLANYDMQKGNAINLFPREQWPIDTLVAFLKQDCEAVKLLHSQDIKEVYVRFATESSVYKFIDENIEYFSKIVNSRIRRELEGNGIFLDSEDLINAVNAVKFMLHEPGVLADETWTQAQKWSYLDSGYHYDYACLHFRIY